METSKKALEFLHNLAEKNGEDFAVSRISQDNGKIRASQWVQFKNYKNSNKIEANQRQIIPNEILIELDATTREENLKIFEEQIKPKLEAENIPFTAWNSGGTKSIHVSAWASNLSSESPHVQAEIKKALLKKWFPDLIEKKVIDLQVFNARHMIALEYAPHFKTGNIKEPIFEKLDKPFKVSEDLLNEARAKQKNRPEIVLPEKNAVNDCAFLGYALKNELPEGQRQQIVSKNLMALNPQLEIIKEYVRTQNSPNISVQSVQGWQGYEFNCAELKKYARELGLNKCCADCGKEICENGYMGIKNFNPRQKVEVLGCLGTISTQKKVNETIQFKVHYKIYELEHGGKLNKNSFLFADAEDTIQKGTDFFYLKPLEINQGKIEFLSEHWPEREFLIKICKEQGIPTQSGEGKNASILSVRELISNIARRHEEKPFLFKKGIGISKQELEKFSREQSAQIVKDYLHEGTEADALMDLIYKPHFFKANPELIPPKRFMPFAPNQLNIFNSKTGKTSMAGKLGPVLTKLTTANALGFGTAKEVNEGTLNGETRTIFIDEISEQNPNQKPNLLAHMETGETEVRSGKGNANVRSYAPICFQGNPQKREEFLGYAEGQREITEFTRKEAMFQEFNDMLDFISTNYKAIGTRIALTIFRDDLKTINAEKVMPLKEIEQNNAIASALIEEAKTPFTELFLNEEVRRWLNQQLSPAYRKGLTEIINETPIVSVREYIEGQRDDAYRHSRGMALRIACVDLIIDLIKGSLDLKELLELADAYVKDIEEENLNSLSRVVKLSTQKKTMQDYLKDCFENLAQHYKILLKALKKTKLENNEIELNKLKEFFEIDISMSKQEVINRLSKNLMRTNKQINRFGVALKGTSEIPIVRVINPVLFEGLTESFNEGVLSEKAN